MLRQETWSFPKWPRRFDSLVMKTKLTNYTEYATESGKETSMRHANKTEYATESGKETSMRHTNKTEYATESDRETSMRHANSLLLVGSFAAAAKTSDTHREEGMKDQKKIRLGLIGVGNWALFAHVRVLRLLPEYEIV